MPSSYSPWSGEYFGVVALLPLGMRLVFDIPRAVVLDRGVIQSPAWMEHSFYRTGARI